MSLVGEFELSFHIIQVLLILLNTFLLFLVVVLTEFLRWLDL